ncbi:UPF0314 protein [Methylopila jiangsuensis]|uniref:UPF0314 protein GCM10008171_19830 n=1 Tax=Methylopila jiangsuensis TaxID=586230 RepID=A0A9W6JJ82_9HYPH|nr:DUF2585 domain-containing protein [Methylopila jiangsuensis]MDR6286921.1 hypothetical protein [Methylopila jiangsuensis]GLK76729.1 UPF0314 protein [Methylopila jiangsuensis]
MTAAPDAALPRSFASPRPWLVGAGLIALFAAILYLMGRPPICPCGTIELWHGNANDSGTSQHVSDWYTPSHVIHGFIFYGVAALIFRGLKVPMPFAWALVAAIAVEGAWEVIENSPLVIERYRANTSSDSYAGDSVLNSVSDILAMVLGFLFARKAPWPLTVALALGMELTTLILIRDNLTLNVLMILYPLEAVKDWQTGG